MKFRAKNSVIFTLLLFILFFSCSKEENTTNTLFSLVKTSKTNIHFTNSVKENLYFNFLNYAYIYTYTDIHTYTHTKYTYIYTYIHTHQDVDDDDDDDDDDADDDDAAAAADDYDDHALTCCC